jgi:hypothetical protein
MCPQLATLWATALQSSFAVWMPSERLLLLKRMLWQTLQVVHLQLQQLLSQHTPPDPPLPPHSCCCYYSLARSLARSLSIYACSVLADGAGGATGGGVGRGKAGEEEAAASSASGGLEQVGSCLVSGMLRFR